jgi:hypothetical protein
MLPFFTCASEPTLIGAAVLLPGAVAGDVPLSVEIRGTDAAV